MDAVELSLFSRRLAAACEEMGAVLRDAAFSPNIRDRLDYSCAVFDARGQLCAQAAHIPVHLGSMAWAMQGIVDAVDWRPGDCLMLNDPFLGGTHLPDVTLVSPFHQGDTLLGFVANRAHHANIGAGTPGSMPLARSLAEEGLVIPPMLLQRDGEVTEAARVCLKPLPAQAGGGLPGDFLAQLAANRAGLERVGAIATACGGPAWQAGLAALNEHGARLAASVFDGLPPGEYRYTDFMEDDGLGGTDLPISVCLHVQPGEIRADFAGTAAQSQGNINCPLPVTAAAVFYALRCLLPEETPDCIGVYRQVRIEAPAGCLVHARPPAAVAAGNVETSMRIVDVLLGALAQALPGRIPAAAQGTMNNLAMGAVANGERPGWDYYETLGGGAGAGPWGDGRSAVQVHMTNTLNTPVEVLESHYPVRVRGYRVRRGSGGAGACRGGDGLEREFEFLQPATITLLTERRVRRPWGLAGGQPGAAGANLLNGTALPGKYSGTVAAGDRLRIETPGGGGFGPPGDVDCGERNR